MKNLKIVLVVFFGFIISCNSKINNEKETTTSDDSSTTLHENNQEQNTFSTFANTETSSCGLEDGTYSATVDYNNSETGYSATYTLNVDVEDCRVVQINFPNEGYLDEDHISSSDIDENGDASVDGEDGKTYEISIDN
jgi:hypothetical protein